FVHVFFFFQAEDGIRDDLVTRVQTCALPIWSACSGARQLRPGRDRKAAQECFGVERAASGPLQFKRAQYAGAAGDRQPIVKHGEIGRASCRERGESWGVAGGGRGEREVGARE